MLLLLIWRHLQYYGEPKRNQLPPAKGASVTNAMRLLATTDPNVFRTEVGTKLQPLLNKLASLELVRSFLSVHQAVFLTVSSRPRHFLANSGKKARGIFRLCPAACEIALVFSTMTLCPLSRTKSIDS